MSAQVNESPVEGEVTLQCGFLLCGERAQWSTLWTCGEVIAYCDEHLRWAQGVQPVSCACDDEAELPPILIVATFPLGGER